MTFDLIICLSYFHCNLHLSVPRLNIFRVFSFSDRKTPDQAYYKVWLPPKHQCLAWAKRLSDMRCCYQWNFARF